MFSFVGSQYRLDVGGKEYFKMAVPFATSSPDPEVPEKAQRRKFSAEDKKRILGGRACRRARRHWRRASTARNLFLDVTRLVQGNGLPPCTKRFLKSGLTAARRNPLAGENES